MTSIPSNSVQLPAATTPLASAAAPAAGGLGKQDFLNLLMAQLKNQDPMAPVDNTAMVAQMAQFSALEATQTLSATQQSSNNLQTVSQAGAMIGKYIQANQSDGTSTTGAVTGVNFTTTAGAVTPTLVVDGQNVDYSTVVEVSSTPITNAG
jgi:flagellar basal-body rod modification protein FlgD